MDEGIELICKNHINRPRHHPSYKLGYGDCSVCIPHVDNKYCQGYEPVHVRMIIVEAPTYIQIEVKR